MWTILMALVATVAALVLAVKLLRGSAPEQQMQRRMKIVQQSEFAPADSESTADIRKTELLSQFPWLHRILVRLDMAARLRRLLEQAEMDRTVEIGRAPCRERV